MEVEIRSNSVVNRWKRVEVRGIPPRVTQGWWVYGGLRPSGPPAPVQTETAGTALSWQGPRPLRFRYHRQNGWRAPPTSWGSLASPSLAPWSIPLWTRESVSSTFSFFFFHSPCHLRLSPLSSLPHCALLIPRISEMFARRPAICLFELKGKHGYETVCNKTTKWTIQNIIVSLSRVV